MDSPRNNPQNVWSPGIAIATTILYLAALDNPNRNAGWIFVAMVAVVGELIDIGRWFGAIKTTNGQKVEGHYLAWLVAWIVLLVVLAFRTRP